MTEPDFSLNRRELLASTLATSTASLLFPQLSAAAETGNTIRIVDTNVSLFHWPFRRLPLDQTEQLVAKLRATGVSEAWAGSFEAIFHRDVAGVNERLAKECQRHPELIPVGCVNIDLPDWPEDLRRCADEHRMHAIRLLPNYHQYTLADPQFAECVKLATDAGLLIQIAAALEDSRTQHPLSQVADVDFSPLANVVSKVPKCKMQILNLRGKASWMDAAVKLPGIYFDTARIDGTDGVSRLLETVPPDRLMLGSHAPFLIPEAVLIRAHENNLSETHLMRLLWENADKVRGA